VSTGQEEQEEAVEEEAWLGPLSWAPWPAALSPEPHNLLLFQPHLLYDSRA